MATASKEKANVKALKNSWKVYLFIGLVATSILTAFVLCSGLFGWSSDTKILIIEVYITLVVIGWFSFASSENDLDFLVTVGVTSSVSFPVIGMISTFNSILFWLSLLIFAALGMLSAIEKSGYKNDIDKFFIAVYSAWVIVGSIVTLGSFSFLPYAQSAIDGANLHIFLSVRFLVTILFLTAFVGKAMVDAFNGPGVAITPLPDMSVPDSIADGDDLVAIILKPVVIVINAILLVIQKITNGIWYAINLLIVFLYRTGINLGNHVYDLLKNKGLWLGIFRVILTFGIIIFLTIIISSCASNLIYYLTNETSVFMITLTNMVNLFIAGTIFSLVTGIIIAECALWQLTPESALTKTSTGGAMFLIGCALSALTVYILAKSDSLDISGFKSLGIYTLLMVFGIGCIFFYQIANRTTSRAAQ